MSLPGISRRSAQGAPTERLVFVAPAGLDTPTGGNRYDQHLAAALADLGIRVELRAAVGSWPEPGPADRADLGRLLRASGPVLVDGLVACGAPVEVGEAVAAGGRVHVLVHMPLALDPGLDREVARRRDVLEGRALRVATGVLATSGWAGDRLRARHRLDAVVVATPGAEPAPVAPGSDPPLLRQLAAVTPVKDQLRVVAALARLIDLHWTAELTGSLDADPDYADRVRRAIQSAGLAARVRLSGPLTGADLERAWQATDLLLLPSRAETWGMVVTEAMARGIPAVVSRGTGSPEALGTAADGALPGAVVEPGQTALTAALRHLLGPGRGPARAAALARRDGLGTWADTARTVRTALALPERTEPGAQRSTTSEQDGPAMTGRPERPVDPGWLALREPADARARDAGAQVLLAPLTSLLSSHGKHTRPGNGLQVVDLGAGTGANLRWLAPRLAALGGPATIQRQRWILLDHDPALRAWGPAQARTVRGDVADLPRLLDGLLEDTGGADLVTASALLDVLDGRRLQDVIAAVVHRRVPVLFSLTVTGQVLIDPPEPLDAVLAAAFDDHQRRGGRLGPGAGHAAVEALRRHGWTAITAPTPWRLGGAGDGPLMDAYFTGRVEAAVEWRPELAGPAEQWLQRRRAQCRAATVRVVVGHLDVVGMPGGTAGASSQRG